MQVNMKIAEKIVNQLSGVDDYKILKCPESTLKRALKQGYTLQQFIYLWYFEHPRRRIPRGLLVSVQERL